MNLDNVIHYFAGRFNINVNTLEKYYKVWIHNPLNTLLVNQHEETRGGSNKVFTFEEELELIDHFSREFFERRIILTQEQVRRHILNYHLGLPEERRREQHFTCSKGWLHDFFSRTKISFHSIFSSFPILSPDAIEERNEYLQELRRVCEQYPYSNIVNVNETFFNVSRHSSKFLFWTGRPLLADILGDPKQGYSLVLSLCADGNMLRPLLIKKGRTARCLNRMNCPEEIIPAFNDRGWMNENMFIYYIDTILIPYFGNNGGVLIMDMLPAHQTHTILHHLNENNIEYLFVPPGQTSTLQPLDCGHVIGSFKIAARRFGDERLSAHPQARITEEQAVADIHRSLNSLTQREKISALFRSLVQISHSNFVSKDS